MKHSSATYLDSGSATKKDYANVRRVLDSALTGYFRAGGKIEKEKFFKHMRVFNHLTEFPCAKQPSGSHKKA